MKFKLLPTTAQAQKLESAKSKLLTARDAACEKQIGRIGMGKPPLTILDVRGPNPKVRIAEVHAIHKGVFAVPVVHGWIGAGLREGRGKHVDEADISPIYNPNIQRKDGRDCLRLQQIGWVRLSANIPDDFNVWGAKLRYPLNGEAWEVTFQEKPYDDGVEEDGEDFDETDEPVEVPADVPEEADAPIPLAVTTLVHLASGLLAEGTLSPDQKASLLLVLEEFPTS